MLQFLTYLFIAIYTATVIGIILVVILGNRNPLKTIPWVVVLIFAPVVRSEEHTSELQSLQ